MGWLGFVLIGGGTLSVWAGVQGVNVVEVVAAVLSGRPVPRTSSSTLPAQQAGDPNAIDPTGRHGGITTTTPATGGGTGIARAQ